MDRERTLDSPTEKLLLSVTAFADKLEREKARQRTHDAMLRKARAGHVTGGRVYGYDNEEVCAETLDAAGRRRRLYVRRVVNAGYKKIADTLNREGVIAPPPRGIGRRQAWAASTVREILHRPLYRGEVVWNQRRKRDGWGLKTYAARDAAEWIRLEAPELRIVSDQTWGDAQARLDGAKAAYLRGTRGRLEGRPANGIESKYLLTGLLQCGGCGAALTVMSGDWKTHRRHAYGCSYNRFRGASICDNNLRSPMALADDAVLSALEHQLLHPDVVELAISKAFAALRPSENHADARRRELRAEIEKVSAELGGSRRPWSPVGSCRPS